MPRFCVPGTPHSTLESWHTRTGMPPGRAAVSDALRHAAAEISAQTLR